MQEFFKVFFISLICDVDNMLILGTILRNHSCLHFTIPAAMLLTFTRVIYVSIIDRLSYVPMFQMLMGIILLFIAYKIVTTFIWGEDRYSHSTRPTHSKVKVLLLLVVTDLLISLDSVLVISGISQHIMPVIIGIFCGLLISLFFLPVIIKLVKTFFWINIIAGGFITQHAINSIVNDPKLANWIDYMNDLFPNTNIVNLVTNGAVILTIIIGIFSYIKHHRITIHR
ncbi:TerC family protein [Peribacillus loiseleuriae]|uniref:TerC family protein n=1 Tax=Peribacillus loiseleuriae TaxID=1679170 RepID=UPI003D041ECB